VRALFADSALQGAFVPVFTELLEKGERREAFRVASSLFFLILLLLGAITALFVLLADERPGLRAHIDRVARATLARAGRPRRWYRLDALPRTSNGKIARAALGAAVAGTDPTAEVGRLRALS
jgi:acyl-CoA synthetase (AMP-forming)/AMP-acid ligase II